MQFSRQLDCHQEVFFSFYKNSILFYTKIIGRAASPACEKSPVGRVAWLYTDGIGHEQL
jgi:hypothetical protein